jgi:hypothetical protein
MTLTSATPTCNHPNKLKGTPCYANASEADGCETDDCDADMHCADKTKADEMQANAHAGADASKLC